MREVQILYQNRSPRPESSLKSETVLLWRILQIHQRQRRFAGEFKLKIFRVFSYRMEHYLVFCLEHCQVMLSILGVFQRNMIISGNLTACA